MRRIFGPGANAEGGRIHVLPKTFHSRVVWRCRRRCRLVDDASVGFLISTCRQRIKTEVRRRVTARVSARTVDVLARAHAT